MPGPSAADFAADFGRRARAIGIPWEKLPPEVQATIPQYVIPPEDRPADHPRDQGPFGDLLADLICRVVEDSFHLRRKTR